MVKRIRNSILLLFISSVFICPGGCFGKERVQQLTLSNGMRILLQNIPDSHVSTILMKVGAGSIHETDRNQGISRLIEWTLFRSSKHFQDVKKEIDAYGGVFQSYTHPDMISFSITIGSPYVENMVDIYADVMKNPVISDSLIEQTRAELIHSLSFELSGPRVIILQVLLKHMFKVHPYRFNPMGDPGTIAALTREDVQAYFNDLYTPDNMVMVVVGSFDRSRMVSKLKDQFGNFEGTAKHTYKWDTEPEQNETREIVETHSLNEKVGLVTIGWHAPSIRNKDTYAMDVLLNTLADGANARLKVQLTDKMEGVYYTWSEYYTPREPGYFFINAVCDPSAVQAVKDTILKEIDIIRKDSITPNELKKSKIKFEMAYTYDQDETYLRATYLGYWSIMENYEFAETYIPNIKKVSLEDIRHIATRYLRTDNYTSTILLPR